jgi:hypothetical protein
VSDDGSIFMNRPVPEHLAEKGFKPVQGASSFSQLRRPDKAEGGRDGSPNPYSGAVSRVRARLETGELAGALDENPATTAEDAAEHGVIDAALDSIVEKASTGRVSRAARDKAYLSGARDSRREAERAAKQARIERREALREQHDTKMKGWIALQTPEYLAQFLTSEGFYALSEQKQAWVHGLVDELREADALEVELNVQALDDEEFDVEAESDEDSTDAWDDEDDSSDVSDDDDDVAGLEGYPSGWN